MNLIAIHTNLKSVLMLQHVDVGVYGYFVKNNREASLTWKLNWFG